MGFLDLITGGGVGALAGAVSGIAGKVIDLKQRDRDLELAKLANAQALALREFDLKQAAQEAATQLQLHQTDADAQVAVADTQALAQSLASDKATYGDSRLGRIVDFLRGITRPVVTYAAMSLVGYTTVKALIQLSGASLPPERLLDIVGQGEFIAAMAISWWFAARPGRLSDYQKR